MLFFFYLIQILATAKKPMVIVGSAILQRADGGAIHNAVANLSHTLRLQSECGEDWRVLNVLHRVREFHNLHNTGSVTSFIY